MLIICQQCGKQHEKSTSHYNRAKKLGLNLFCSLQCAGKFKKLNKSIEQKKLEKRLYDMEYRKKNAEILRIKKHEYNKKDYASRPEHYKKLRKKKQARHNEYCRQEWYKKYKSEYDKKYLAQKKYGELWESAILINQIDKEILKHTTKYEIRFKNNTLNKAQKRRRNGNTKCSIT
jgi:hypothetical protein